VVIQNDIGNTLSGVTNVVALTSFKESKKILPTHVVITPSKQNGLSNKSVALLEQIRAIPNDRIVSEPIGMLEDRYWYLFDEAVKAQIPFLRGRYKNNENVLKQRRDYFSYKQKTTDGYACRAV
jgi:mRNA-degrading endonuclease toxin of MazEF toxin-antitoxin module